MQQIRDAENSNKQSGKSHNKEQVVEENERPVRHERRTIAVAYDRLTRKKRDPKIRNPCSVMYSTDSMSPVGRHAGGDEPPVALDIATNLRKWTLS